MRGPKGFGIFSTRENAAHFTEGVPLSYEAAQKSIETGGKRIAELDRVLKRIYKDDVNGAISHERFLILSAEYEAKQKELMEFVQAEQNAVHIFKQDKSGGHRWQKVQIV